MTTHRPSAHPPIRRAWPLLAAFALGLLAPTLLHAQSEPTTTAETTSDPFRGDPEAVRVANLIYGPGKTSVCYADKFLKTAADETHIKTTLDFAKIRLESSELFDHPFSVMTGEGGFSLTDAQRDNLKLYLDSGGFVIASAGCSSKPWAAAFRDAIAKVFPDHQLEVLDETHAVFTNVFDVRKSTYKRGAARLPHLEALTLDGRVALIFSPDGINDTANAGKGCCCCGGNELRQAQHLNVNILAYALTH
ncbi:MAG: DUF4159 domain-containing protein [Planctomycetota bacterium]